MSLSKLELVELRLRLRVPICICCVQGALVGIKRSKRIEGIRILLDADVLLAEDDAAMVFAEV